MRDRTLPHTMDALKVTCWWKIHVGDNGCPHARTRVCTRGRSSYLILYLCTNRIRSLGPQNKVRLACAYLGARGRVVQKGIGVHTCSCSHVRRGRSLLDQIVYMSRRSLMRRIPQVASRRARPLPSLPSTFLSTLLIDKLTKAIKSVGSVATRAPIFNQACISSLWKVGRCGENFGSISVENNSKSSPSLSTA